MTQELETRTVRTVFLRLMPLLMGCYLLAYLDRINIGFAAVTMNHDLGLDAYHYGLGAGLFFWGYFFFEVPSNLMLQRFGARRWIARIMVTWGLVSMGTAFIRGWVGFLILRFILGVAEAGLFPGVILYLTYWFPAAYRARIIAAFMVAIPLSLAVGSPISTAILAMDGIAGFKGWQWLFLIEGAPTILLAIIVLMVLRSRQRFPPRRKQPQHGVFQLVVFLAVNERTEALIDRGDGRFHRRAALLGRGAGGRCLVPGRPRQARGPSSSARIRSGQAFPGSRSAPRHLPSPAHAGGR